MSEAVDLLKRSLSAKEIRDKKASDKMPKQLNKKSMSTEEEESDMTEIQLPNLKNSKANGKTTDIPPEDTNKSVFIKALTVFRSNVQPICVYDIIRFFSRGSREENPSFYEPLVDLLLSTKLSVSRHVLMGQELYPPLLTRLVGMSKSSAYQETILNPNQVHCSENVTKETATTRTRMRCHDDIENISRWTGGLPEELSDFSRLAMTMVDKILEQGRSLSSPDDLELLKGVMESRKKGWYELLCLGLKNKSIQSWWAKGFYDLVWEKEAVLCTETNVVAVMDVLAHSLTTGADDHWTTKLYRLFSIMFRRLPIKLQEKIVLTALAETPQGGELTGSPASTSRGGNLVRLMSKQQVVLELMPLLNKVTSGNVDKLVTSVLWLCLYSVDTVLDHLVLAAVDNKGQVSPVVKILQHCPRLCALPSSLPSSPSSGPVERGDLCRALCGFIAATQLSESQARNLINFLTALCKRYTPDRDVTTRERPTPQRPVFEPTHLLHHILQPSLDAVYTDGQAPSVRCLRLDVALSVLVSVVEADLPGEDFLLLEPICLSILVSDLYSLHIDPWVEGELDKVRVKTKQVALKCATVLSTTIHKHRDLFSNFQFDWLLQKCAQSGWVHLALAWSAFPRLWDKKIASTFDALIDKAFKQQDTTNTSALMVLLQLCSISERVCTHTMTAIQRDSPEVDTARLVVVIRQMYTMCLPCETAKAVQCVKALVQHSSASQHSPNFSVVETSSLLQTALLGLLKWELTERAMAFVLANHQAALQTVLPKETSDLDSVRQVMCHILETLTHFTDMTLTHTLQVTALDVLGQLQSALKEEGERRKTGRASTQANEEKETKKDKRWMDGTSRKEEPDAQIASADTWKIQTQELLQSLHAHVLCVPVASVTTILQRKLLEILER